MHYTAVLRQIYTEIIKDTIELACYGPYIQDSTGIKRELVLDQNQYMGRGTDGTSGVIE